MIEQLFMSFLPSIEHVHLMGYWIAFFAALFETTLVIGLLLPGSTLLLLLGALAASGKLDLGDLLWFAIMGAVLGDNFNYWLGQRYGQRWTRAGIWFITSAHIERAHHFMEQHGAKSVFFARFIPSIKEIAPFIAGSFGMPRRTFMVWNILGAIGWGCQWVGGGYLFGQSLKLAEAWMSRASMILVILLLIGVLLWFLWRFIMRHGRNVVDLAIVLVRSLWSALSQSSYIQQFTQRHPECVRFLAKRVDRTHFFGLPLTIFALAFTYVLALFAGIVEDIITADPIVAFDHSVAQLIAAVRTPEIVHLFIWITSLGETSVLVTFLCISSLVLWLSNLRFVIIGLLVSSSGASLFSMLGKLTFQRLRPIEASLLESSYSFPSGHATEAVAFYGFIGYLLIRTTRSWKWQVRLFFAFLVLVVLIGLSRIVLGVHYVSDVWAGYLVGSLWLIVGITLTEWFSTNGRIAWHAVSDRRSRIIASGLIVIAITGFISYAGSRDIPNYFPPPELSAQINSPIDELLRAKNLSRTMTPLGEPEQPLTFAIAAPNITILSAWLGQAGWHKTDGPEFKNILRLIQQKLDYENGPLPPFFWNNQMNDLAFEQAIQVNQRKVIATIQLWHTQYQIGGKEVFVGTVRNFDEIRWGVFHKFLPDVDAAVEGFIQSIKNSGQHFDICQRALVPSMVGTFGMGDSFFTRGGLWLIDQRDQGNETLLCGLQRQGID
nr:VTT domain-containing protein [uncultured Tolumonas sp.]